MRAFALSLIALALVANIFLPGVTAQPRSQTTTCQEVRADARIYWHYVCVKDEFDRITRAHGTIAKYYEIGKSVRGNPIYVLEVANRAGLPEGAPRPAFYLDAAHHGNEIQGTEAAMTLARKVTSEYGKNATVTGWVDNFTIYINPVVNPDGNILNQRQNANGVDLNRNYPYQHGQRATAAGPGGASEPEVKANVAFMTAHRDIDVYLSLHTGTWDYVVPRCDPGTFRGRIPTDDEPLYLYALAELINVTHGMGNRGASGTGESICWAYDIIEVWSLLPEVATEQNVPFTAAETVQMNNAMLGIYWMLERTGRFGSNLEPALASDGEAGVIEVHNSGLQVATNWTFELNYEGSKRAPLIRGNQPIEPGATLRISIPKQYLVGSVKSHLTYEHLNVNPLVSDPQQGIAKGPFVEYLNFTQAEVERLARTGDAARGSEGASSPALEVALLALAFVAIVAIRRRRGD